MDEIIGKVVEGKVIGLTPFGAFIWTSFGKRGFVHISQITDNFVRDISDHLAIDDVVKVRIISRNKNGDLNLSIKNVHDEAPLVIPRRHCDDSFEEKLHLFLKESREVLSDLKKNIEAKRKQRKKR